jgi:hypothetical protein
LYSEWERLYNRFLVKTEYRQSMKISSISPIPLTPFPLGGGSKVERGIEGVKAEMCRNSIDFRARIKVLSF